MTLVLHPSPQSASSILIQVLTLVQETHDTWTWRCVASTLTRNSEHNGRTVRWPHNAWPRLAKDFQTLTTPVGALYGGVPSRVCTRATTSVWRVGSVWLTVDTARGIHSAPGADPLRGSFHRLLHDSGGSSAGLESCLCWCSQGSNTKRRNQVT